MTTATPRAARNAVRWTLPDDGIIDLIAVEIAAAGARPVALTPAERRAAAARILAAGGGTSRICKRLHVSGSTARRLTAGLCAQPVPPVIASPPAGRAVSELARPRGHVSQLA